MTKSARLKTNDIMGENLKEHQHPQWGSILGYATEIHLAVLKDELSEWKQRLKDDPDQIPYLGYIRDTLTSRIKEIEEDTNETTIKKEWLSADEWSERVQELRKEERQSD